MRPFINRLRKASLSRDVESAPLPALVHSLHEEKNSVLSLAADDVRIFSGSQNNYISVWDKKSFTLTQTLQGHTGSVLALEYASDRKWLFSSSGDSTIRIWSTITLAPVYVLTPYLETGAGDLFSLAWSPQLQTIFVGCQNTSLQWYQFETDINKQLQRSSSSSSVSSDLAGASTPGQRKAHKFFDSYPSYERKPADLFAKNALWIKATETSCAQPQAYLDIPPSNVIDSAHWGYIYCMDVIDGKDAGGVLLLTGSGDETVKIWKCSASGQPSLEYSFPGTKGAVYAIAATDETVYAACQDGYVKVIDVETKTQIRSILVEEAIDILSMCLHEPSSDLYTGSANGLVRRWDRHFNCSGVWHAHDGIVLSYFIAPGREECGVLLLTGGSDNDINVWDIQAPSPTVDETCAGDCLPPKTSATDILEYALSKFVAIPSVSSCEARREDCRQAAIWLKKCLNQLGSQSMLLPTGETTNPLVFAKFSASAKACDPNERKPHILFYGHYDVMPAPQQGWNSDPFDLVGRNGYLYGRGVTDDKGPIIAVACAAAELRRRRALGADVSFLIEGEEECGSTGFDEAVKKYKDSIGHVDVILVSNSTWIAEDEPCITYGLRGVVHCSLQISNSLPDLHSGIEGGAVREPMLDMIRLLGTLTDADNKVQIPAFYDDVRARSEEEMQLLNRLSIITNRASDCLARRWREPAMTVHNIDISGPKNATVIPSHVSAQVSIRIVPDQCMEKISDDLQSFLRSSFEKLGSPNKLDVHIDKKADWWLGELNDPWFKTLEKAIYDEWGIMPLRIREGGSIPSVPFLEKEFGCHALHLPMGQSSDQAHLPNERISIANLHRGKAVVEHLFSTPVMPK
ncbi:Zn-dependent exopeptidase [Fistulina hepatica ATCC 64428]|uniref:Zn-dependent exopeptidase n=1 Tax=Fistulina hepatica ATCC 64428 TaxID=1128425 RepID=A0A0D7AKY0_9AGAR|nr:Zn-dependent exopeptidase [Fistulina hepatica ATCC 64428]